jgi:mRNA-degrading endonuclease RelE of RelBE toxin-antitoxin system
MKFDITLLPEAEEELYKIEKIYRNKALKDYRTVEQYGNDYVNIKALQDDLYEIKSDNVRSLFTYKKGR